MGNIYFEQRKFPAAIKMYRMALDQVPPADRSARTRMLRNIAIAFVKLGQYQVCPQSQVHGRRSLLCGISSDACPAARHGLHAANSAYSPLKISVMSALASREGLRVCPSFQGAGAFSVTASGHSEHSAQPRPDLA